MNPDQTSLDRLHDLVVPPPIPWWPPAPGWYWLLAILAALFIWALFAGLIHTQRTRYRREALREWRECDRLVSNSATRAEAMERLATLLKRVALSVAPRNQVAPLTGTAWDDYLEKHRCADGIAEALERVAYDPRQAASFDQSQIESFSDASRKWISSTRPPEFSKEEPRC